MNAQELLEKWIVVRMNDGEEQIKVTRRDNFERKDLCDCYSDYGQKVGCYNAGCYSLDNSASKAQSDCSSAILEKFNVCVSLEECAHGWTVISAIEDDELSDISEIEKFIVEWRKENECHTEVTAWTYHDSHNFQTLVLECDFGEPSCEELPDEEQVKILSQMPETAPYISQGASTSEETEDYIFHFDLWATNPWFCEVEVK